MSHIGKELAVARVLYNKTARQIARETGIHKTEISRIERGRENPSQAKLDILRKAVGWTPQISFFVNLVLGPNNGAGYDALQATQAVQESPSEVAQAS